MHYLALVPVCLAVAAVFIVVEKAERYVAADVIKGTASALFVILGLLGSALSNDAAFARMVVLGLVMGAIADVLLNLRYVFEGNKGQLAFLAGILVFLAGHVCYIAASVPFCPLLPAAVGIGLVATGALMYWIFARIEAKLPFKVFGVFYLGAITVLNVIALFCLVGSHNAHWLVFFVGALLFLVSDVILILNTFGPKKSFLMRVSNLMLYYAGQLMIAFCLQLPL